MARGADAHRGSIGGDAGELFPCDFFCNGNLRIAAALLKFDPSLGHKLWIKLNQLSEAGDGFIDIACDNRGTD